MASTLSNNDQLDRVNGQMRILRGRYLEKLPATAESIERLLRFCEYRALTPGECTELQMVSHKLAGTGATYGFPDISTIARLLTDRLKAEPEVFDASLVKLTLSLVSACRLALVPEAAPPATTNEPAPRHKTFGRRAGQGGPGPSLRPASLPRILVVDDDEAIRTLFSDLLRAEATVDTAVNAEEALEKIDCFRPDLVLLDDIMPGSISGLSLLEHIRKDPEFGRMPVIMITASDAPEDIDRGLSAGAAHYITKPFIAELAYFAIHQTLGGHKIH
jgi:CheY-like chemotaxis protein